MKLFIALVIVILFFCNCGQEKATEEKMEAKDNNQQDPALPQPPVHLNQLNGVWTDGSTENSTFTISNKQIQYTDQLQSIPFSFFHDSIQIEFASLPYKAHFILSNDTLILNDENGETKFFRFTGN